MAQKWYQKASVQVALVSGAFAAVAAIIIGFHDLYIPTTNDNLQKHWEQAKSENTIAAYEEFLSKYPEVEFTDKAYEKITFLYIRQYIENDNQQQIQVYLNKHLINDLKNEDPNVRKKAAKILQMIKDSRAVEPLIAVLVDSINREDQLPDTLGKIGSLTNPIDQILDELRHASIVFNAPETMKVNETLPIILLMSKELSSKDLTFKLRRLLSDSNKINKTYWDTVKVSTKMEAHLSGHGFIIKPITPVAQLIPEKNDTRWEWTVFAEKEGLRTLYLTLNAYIDYKNDKTTQTIQTYRKNVFVYVKPTDAILDWIGKNISWIAGLIGIVLGVIVTHWLNLSNKRKKQEEHREQKKTKIILPKN